ncbi:cupin domain-containing protein [Bradyrhizobium sp. 143]|uniref:cupin domain-containing protein n=1 Tax=Bradyrhizobium sp. 143 TaxID=2782619 RepID=UPI001FF8EDA5|nr:cupin domain-containing protein [Bradyrhizobium sp. 143]MCK1715586.1 cupin domain-containing protein [Bradyrhizobium sp. 143]
MNNQRPMPRTITPHAITWNATAPGFMRKTIWAEPMWDDPSVPRQMAMMRYEPGFKSPLQKQVGGDEIVFVIEGVLSDEFGSVAAGNVAYRPEGCVYSLSALYGATTVSYLVGSVEPAAERPANSPPTQIINVNEMPWQPAEGDSLHEKAIWRDTIRERRFVLFKFAPGIVVELHEHIGEELAFQLEGSFVDEAGLLRAGDVGFRPFGCHHSWVSQNGGVALAYIWGHGEYVRDQK